MSKTSLGQRLARAGQPYTRIAADKKYVEVELPHPTKEDETMTGLRAENCFSVFGYTLEYKLQPEKKDADPEWADEWEEHDLGQAVSLDEAKHKAAKWLEQVIGVYPIR